MKKFLLVLTAVIGFGMSAYAHNDAKSHYKESYSTVFMCIVKTEVNTGGQTNVVEAYDACKNGSYAEGYEDGYNNRPYKKMVDLFTKLFKLVTSYGTNAPSVSAETISYTVGYRDGEKDKAKEGR